MLEDYAVLQNAHMQDNTFEDPLPITFIYTDHYNFKKQYIIWTLHISCILLLFSLAYVYIYIYVCVCVKVTHTMSC